MSTVEDSELQSSSEELLQWSVHSSAQETVVALAGEIDLATADGARRVLADVVAGRPRKIVVDLARVTFLDSTGIREIMTAANAAAEVGAGLVVRNPTATIARTLKICGLHDLLVEGAGGNDTEASTGS